jgi:hypothetical protein
MSKTKPEPYYVDGGSRGEFSSDLRNPRRTSRNADGSNPTKLSKVVDKFSISDLFAKLYVG